MMKHFLITAFLLVALSTTAQAEMTTDSTELGFQLAHYKFDDFDFTFGNLAGGKLISDDLMGKGVVFITDSDGGSSWGVAGEAQKLFPSKTNPDFVPYIFAGLSVSNDEAGTGLGVPLGAGMKQFLSEKTAIQYELRHNAAVTGDLESYTIISIGVNFYL